MRWLFSLLAVLLIAAADPAPNDEVPLQPPETVAAKPTSTANGSLRILFGPERTIGTVGIGLLDLVRSQAILKAVVAQVSPEAAKAGSDKIARIDTPQGIEGVWPGMLVARPPEAMQVPVQIVSFDKRVPADKLLRTLPDVLRDELVKLDVEHVYQVERHEALTGEVEQLQAELEHRRSNYFKQMALLGMPSSPELAAQSEARARNELQAVAVSVRGLGARQQILEQQIADTIKKMSADSANDAGVAELEKGVQIREQIVANFGQVARANQVPITTVQTAQVELAQLKADLAKARREAAQAAGGQRLAQLRDRLDDTAIELAEKAAEESALQDQLRQSANLSGILGKRIEIDLLERSYREVAEELNKLGFKLRLYRPLTVTLVE